MSDKPRKEFNAEDLANACLENKDCMKCPGLFICEAFDRVGAACPQYLDLTDPPRFTEAQMALLKALYALGVAELEDDPVYDQIIMLTPNGRIGGFKNTVGISLPLHSAETLDLAEMFGKDAT